MSNIDSFAKRLNARALSLNSPLCVGLDPFVNLLPPLFGNGNEIKAWHDFFIEIIDIIGDKVPAIKPQIGLFEPWGGAGIELVSELSKTAKQKGALVILDAKRGDIGSTAQGYADAYMGPNAIIDCDCITLNPYMGLETLEPFAKYAIEMRKSIAVLVRTSNPGSQDFQELDCNGAPLWVRVAQSLKSLETRLFDGEASSLMVVIGATWPQQAQKLREILPHTQFLIPGFGAQGGSADGALAGFVKKGNNLENGVINSSRGILYPNGAKEAQNLKDWRQIIIKGLEAANTELRNASANVINGG
jgi:orotidine-5'-phosphate decarboxylase